MLKFFFILCMSMATVAFSKDRAHELFEWGEYDSLLSVLDQYFFQVPKPKDTGETCRYFSYRGVAYFAKGNIAEAQNQFHKALECDSDLTLDDKYVTPEMENLFIAAKTEVRQQHLRARQEDSLRIVRENSRKEFERKKTLAASIRSSFLKNTGITLGMFTVSIVTGILADREYSYGQKDFAQYKIAADLGDKARYDYYRSQIQDKNRLILEYSVAAGASGLLGAYFGWRSIARYRMHLSLRTMKGRYAMAGSYEF